MLPIQNQNVLGRKKRQCDPKSEPSATSKSLKANTGPTVMQKMLKQNLSKQVEASIEKPFAVHCKRRTQKNLKKLVLQVCNQHHMSTSTPTINVQNMYQHKN